MSVENRLARLEQKVNAIRGDQRTVFVDNLASGITIRGSTVKQPVSAVGGGSSSAYTGPWAVIKKDATTVTVKSTFIGQGYYMSQIIGGLTTTYLSADVDISVSQTGRIIADITVSGDSYAVTCSYYNGTPGQSIQHYYVTLAWIKCVSGSITDVYQCQYGDIYLAGRVV